MRLLARHARSLLHIPLAGRQRIERCPPGLEAGWPPWPATRLRHVWVSIPSRHGLTSRRPRQRTHVASRGDVRVSIPSGTRSQRAGFTSSLTSQSGKQESNLPDVSGPNGAALLGPIPGCTPSVSSRPLRCFKPALSPDQLEVRGDPFRNRTGLARLKGGHPHQKTNGPLDGRPFLLRRLPGLEPPRGIEPRRAAYETALTPSDDGLVPGAGLEPA